MLNKQRCRGLPRSAVYLAQGAGEDFGCVLGAGSWRGLRLCTYIRGSRDLGFMKMAMG